jgi:chemotaxis protein CheX
MQLQETDITQIVTTIWQSVLGVDCVQSADFPQTSAGCLATCVQITGAWQGAVILSCPEAFAARAATVMFDTPVEDRKLTDMQDAIAELTNMIGGNLKGLLPVTDACQLSLPAVIAGADFTTRIPGSRLIHRIALDCGGQTIVVNVLEKLPTAKAA